MQPHSRLEDLQILLVDDERQIRRLVSDVLLHLGFKDIATAGDGLQAMQFVTLQPFDFIITDWRMPEVEGIELVRFVRYNTNCLCPHVPIIMLSGNTESHYVFEARDAGVNEYMIKPFSAIQIARRMRAIIERPRCFIETQTYHGPNRRWHAAPNLFTKERRVLPDISATKERRAA